jgi:hypothetical protein
MKSKKFKLIVPNTHMHHMPTQSLLVLVRETWTLTDMTTWMILTPGLRGRLAQQLQKSSRQTEVL